MAEFRGIQMSLYLILLLQFTAGTARYTFISVRDGKDVTLYCNYVGSDQDECGGTTWGLIGSVTEELVLYGKITEKAKVKSDRLSLAAYCSLVIKKVTAEDAGQYICQQTSSETQQQVYLSVVTLTKREHDDKVTLSCSVTTRPVCRHTVKWLFREKGPKDMTTSESNCSATVTFLTSLTERSKFVEFKCEVFDIYSRNVQMFTFNHQSSSEKQGERAKEATTTSTATTSKPTSRADHSKPSTQSSAVSAGWWGFIIVFVVAAALIVVVFIRWKKTKGNKTQTDKDSVPGNEGDELTYSMVTAPGSSADPCQLHATIT